MSEKDSVSERYSILIEMIHYEGQLLWSVFGNYLMAHTIFVAIVLQSNPLAETGWRPILFVSGVIGLLLYIPWLAALQRHAAYFGFRIAQARAAEPKAWDLFCGDGQKFSKGTAEVKIDGVHYGIPLLARKLKARHSAMFLIAVFAIIYVWFLAANGPWWGPVPKVGA